MASSAPLLSLFPLSSVVFGDGEGVLDVVAGSDSLAGSVALLFLLFPQAVIAIIIRTKAAAKTIFFMFFPHFPFHIIKYHEINFISIISLTEKNITIFLILTKRPVNAIFIGVFLLIYKDILIGGLS
jgi:hypothetical protein